MRARVVAGARRRLPTVVLLASLALALAQPVAPPAAADDLPQRRITIHGTEPKLHVFGVRGRVEGAWAEKRVTVQRKNCRRCGWFAWRTVRTDDDKRYAAPVRAPPRGARAPPGQCATPPEWLLRVPVVCPW